MIRYVRGSVHLHASPTLHQVFRCERSASVEQLQEGKLDQSIFCLHLPRSVLGFGFRSAGKFFVFYSESQQVHLHASPTLHQLFRCKRSVTVERLQEGKLDRSSHCLHLPRYVLGFGFRSAEFFLFYTPNPNNLGKFYKYHVQVV